MEFETEKVNSSGTSNHESVLGIDVFGESKAGFCPVGFEVFSLWLSCLSVFIGIA